MSNENRGSAAVSTFPRSQYHSHSQSDRVQRRSYERFLQMDKLPSERDDSGLQSVFTSVFPITDFRNISQLDFVDFSIGNWECKCGHLKGLHHLRTTCVHCGAMVITDPFHPGDVR